MTSRPFAILGLFDSAQALMQAIPVVKSQVRARLDAYTPYPVHGIEEALSLRKSPIGGMVFVMGLIGALSALGFELWVQGVDYPLVTAGKPVFSWEALIPIVFEVTVLFACFTSGLGMLLLLNRLPFFRHPMLRSGSMPFITRDKFALAVEADGQALDADEVAAVLRGAGAQMVEVIAQPAPPRPVAPGLILKVGAGIVISCLVAGYLTYWGVKFLPISIPVVHMLEQPRLDPQSEDPYFADGAGMRMPVAGTVARGHLPSSLQNQDAAASLANPLPMTESVLAKGRQGFTTFCSVCHGVLGDGKLSLTAAYGAKPANLVSQQIRDYQDGKIYYVIAMGKNAMPSYASDLSPEERWAVVHYVRVLQRALNAKEEDFGKEAPK